MDDLRRNSGDMYTALQSVYVQRREALVNDLDPAKTSLPDIE
jgi:phospholipid-binding lipoprotein MlaA